MMPHIPPERLAEAKRQQEIRRSNEAFTKGVLWIAGYIVVGLIIWFISIWGWKAVLVLAAIPLALLLSFKNGREIAGKAFEKLIPWIIAVALFFYIGAKYGWNRHYWIPIPFMSGPSKPEIRAALGMGLTKAAYGEDWLEIVDRLPTIQSSHYHDKDCKCREGTTLYPIRLKTKLNKTLGDNVALYFYKDDFGTWKPCWPQTD